MKKNKSLKQVIRDRYKDFPSEFTDIPTKELAETLIKKNKLKNPADVVASEIRVFMSTNNIKKAKKIGGLTVPLIKAVLRANEQIKADFDWMGHFHSRMALPNVFINGSICGFNGYAARKGFRPDRAVQSFALIDKVRGATVTAPIFLE